MPQLHQHLPQSTDVEQQDVVMSEQEQDTLSLTASWDKESFLQTETQDPDLTQTSADLTPQPFPAFPDFLEKVKSSWQHLASVPSMSKSTVTLASMEGAESVGLAQFPPVDSTIAALVRAPCKHRRPLDSLSGQHAALCYPSRATSFRATCSLGHFIANIGVPRASLGQKPDRLSSGRQTVVAVSGEGPGCGKVHLIGCAYLPWPYFWTSSRGDSATLRQVAAMLPFNASAWERGR
ncbi:UNVERIFIED_CONTAM: hypothetical protein FKN15_055733 [Acipenser sinensis]